MDVLFEVLGFAFLLYFLPAILKFLFKLSIAMWMLLPLFVLIILLVLFFV